MPLSLTSSQIRAARGLLGWTRAKLADLSGVSEPTIQRIESGSVQPHDETKKRIAQTFAAYDVEFLPDDGIKKRSDTISQLEGVEDFKFFMDQVYEAALQPYSVDGTKPICICNLNNSLFRKYMGDYHAVHVERLKKIRGLQIRSLAAELDKGHVKGADYLAYRYLKALKAVVAPFYVFGDKFAVIDFNALNAPRVLMIHSALWAGSYRNQFEIMWNGASSKPPA